MREWHWNGSWSERTGQRKRGQRKVYELFRYVYYTSNYISQSTHICSKFRRAQDQTWDPNLLPDPHGDYLQHPQGLPHPTRLSWHQQKSHSAMEKFNCQNQSSSFMQSLTVGNCKWMRNHATKWVCLHDVSCIKINLFLRPTVYWHRFSQRVTFHTYRTSPSVSHFSRPLHLFASPGSPVDI